MTLDLEWVYSKVPPGEVPPGKVLPGVDFGTPGGGRQSGTIVPVKKVKYGHAGGGGAGWIFKGVEGLRK